jgi:hypothetical protein
MHDHAAMLLLTITKHDGLRLAELGLALTAVAGVAFFLGALAPFGRKPGNAIGGITLAAGAVLLLIAAHWGHFG